MVYASTFLVLTVAIGGISLAVAVFTRLAGYRTGATSPTSASSYAAYDSSPYEASHYAPMVRLLDAEEVEFLESQEGISANEISKFRQDRRLIFREYLSELAADFHRIHAQARMMVATAPEEHSDLVGMLMGQQLAFWKAMFMIECQLALEVVGVRNINPQPLVDLVNSFNLAVVRAEPGALLA
ncbi:MAG: hypothetical protein ABI824_09845 [Acidobacteriota bacterium]